MMLRLDKFLSSYLGITRKEAILVVKQSRVTVNDAIVKNAALKISESDLVFFDEHEVKQTGPQYFMMNKPAGYVCSHEDDYNPTVFVLLDEMNPEKFHLAGRLDCDTTGLLLLTDDGQWSHRVTSPKRQCPKTYRAWLADPVQPHYAAALETGIQLKSEKSLTLPAVLQVVSEKEVLLTIHEGKYHQVKRMFAALGNKVEALHRESVGTLSLDFDLAEGEYRALTPEEISMF